MAAKKTIKKPINKKIKSHPDRREMITNQYPDYEDELLFADGFDDAIEGVVEGFGSNIRVCYDREKMYKIMIKQGMTYEEAVEYFDYNIIGAYVGEFTPVFIDKI